MVDNQKAVAVIGLSFEFPNVDNLDDFWQGLVDKRCFYNRSEKENDSTTVHAWGGPADIKGFDYRFFDYSYKEACYMDPQQRLLLQHSWLALENAGYAHPQSQSNIGVYASASINQYLTDNLAGYSTDGEDEVVLGNTADFLATRIAYKLGCKGPAFTIQSGCSSSLVSVHEARVALLTAQCDVALAAAVSLSAPQDTGYDYTPDGIRSKSGLIQPYSEDASGTVFTNGVAVLVLKRLTKAIADNDHIYGVIASSALNNDGAQKASFTAPSSKQQAAIVAKAMRIANAKPQEYVSIEGHGTGTAIGDPIEVNGLMQAFSQTPADASTALQSVKANVGHLDTVSGLAGLIKSMLVLDKGYLPPQANFTTLNKKISFDNTPFHVNTNGIDFGKDSSKKYIGVTALGIGGTNAHVVMQRFNKGLRPEHKHQEENDLVLLSAKDKKSLFKQAEQLEQHLANATDEQLKKIAYTSQLGRAEASVRAFVFAEKKELMQRQLQNLNLSVVDKKPAPVVFMFPGQGSQYPAMAQGLYEAQPHFKSLLDNKLALLTKITQKDFTSIWQEKNAGKDSALYQTINTQPLLLAIEVALAQFLIHLGVKPAAMIGHSLGEYAAVVVAGCLDFDDAAKLVCKRAELMESTPVGAMCSSFGELSAITQLIETCGQDKIEIAAHNGPNLYTLSGDKDAIAQFVELALEHKIIAQLLPANRGFHSYLLEPILEEYKKEIEQVQFKTPQIEVISNLTGKPLTAEQVQSSTYWCQQIRHAVLFKEGIETLCTDNTPLLVEVGPGTNLETLSQKISGNDGSRAITHTLPHPKSQSNAYGEFLKSLGNLWQHGCRIDWAQLYNGDGSIGRTPYPGTVFNNTECWVEPQQPKQRQNGLSAYQRYWRQVDINDSNQAIGEQEFVVVSKNNPFEDSLLKIDAKTTLIPSLDATFIKEKQSAVATQHLLFNFDGTQNSFQQLLSCCQLIKAHDDSHSFKYCTLIVNNASAFQNTSSPIAASLQAAVKSIRQEMPGLHTTLIDVNNNDNLDALLPTLLVQKCEWPVIALRGGEAFVESFTDITDKMKTSDEKYKHALSHGVALLLGGTGQVGLQYTQALLAHTELDLILVQRSPVDTITSPQNAKQTAKQQAIFSLQEQYPNRFSVVQADIANQEELEAICEPIKQKQQIAALIHIAGIDASMHYKLLTEVDTAFVDECFYAKQHGMQVMAEVAEKYDIAHCHVISSISSVIGGVGMMIYGALHSYIDEQIQYLNKTHASTWSTINWEAWGFANQEDEPEAFQQGAMGDHLDSLAITPQQGRDFICDYWYKQLPQVILSSEDLIHRYETWVLGQTEMVDTNPVGFMKAERPELQADYRPPSSVEEQKIATIWSDVLAIKDIGLNDNFFDLGGHSLLALKMVTEINQSMKQSLSIVDLFTYPSIGKLAQKITSARTTVLSKQVSARANKKREALAKRNKRKQQSGVEQ